MSINSNQETVELVGTVTRKYEPTTGIKNGKKWYLNKFQIHTIDGRDLSASKFGKLDVEIGADVKFQSTRYNDTNYTVVGELEAATDLVGAAVNHVQVPEVVEQPTAKRVRRGRPVKTTDVADPNTEVGLGYLTATEVAIRAKAEAETYQDEALTIVRRNLTEGRDLLVSLGYNNADYATIVTVGDMLGRTRVALRIERNKDRRMTSFNK